HQHEAIAAACDMADDLFLRTAKRGQAKYVIQHRKRIARGLRLTAAGRFDSGHCHGRLYAPRSDRRQAIGSEESEEMRVIPAQNASLGKMQAARAVADPRAAKNEKITRSTVRRRTARSARRRIARGSSA